MTEEQKQDTQEPLPEDGMLLPFPNIIVTGRGTYTPPPTPPNEGESK